MNAPHRMRRAAMARLQSTAPGELCARMRDATATVETREPRLPDGWTLVSRAVNPTPRFTVRCPSGHTRVIASSTYCHWCSGTRTPRCIECTPRLTRKRPATAVGSAPLAGWTLIAVSDDCRNVSLRCDACGTAKSIRRYSLYRARGGRRRVRCTTCSDPKKALGFVLQRLQEAAPGSLLARMRECTPVVKQTPAPVVMPRTAQRIADDAALEAAGYEIVSWMHVRDRVEGHRVLRSVALSRIAGRAA